jgi:hypothetical protein
MAASPSIIPTAIPPGARRRIQASTNLLHQWLEIAHPGAIIKYEMRLGPTPLSIPGFPVSPATEAMLRNNNMYADAVVIEPTQIFLIEAKIVATPSAISQLRAYASLVLGTPELSSHTGKQLIEMHLWAVDGELAHQLATQAGQAVTIYTPPWIEEYLATTYWKRRSAAVLQTPTPGE